MRLRLQKRFECEAHLHFWRRLEQPLHLNWVDLLAGDERVQQSLVRFEPRELVSRACVEDEVFGGAGHRWLTSTAQRGSLDGSNRLASACQGLVSRLAS